MSSRYISWSARAALGCACALLLVCVVAALSVSPAGAAKVKPVGGQRPVTSPEARAQLQQVLEQNAPALEAQATVIKAVAKLFGPTVVHIEADVPQRTLVRHIEENGSGVIIERKERFYVLTNQHVFRNAPADDIRIYLADGRRLHPQRVLQDEATDVGVLAIDAPNLIASPVGDSDRMEIGDFVLAVGSPLGLRHSVTFGIISAKGRRDLHLGDATIRFQDFLQTDAAINPGNSGGPLLNSAGQVVGINDAILTNTQNMGFAIPIDLARRVIPDLIEMGHPYRPMLGFTGSEVTASTAALFGLPVERGFLVEEVMPGSPAQAAGLRSGSRMVAISDKPYVLGGDIIVAVDGEPFVSAAQLAQVLLRSRPGQQLRLKLFRDGQTVEIELPLEKMQMQF